MNIIESGLDKPTLRSMIIFIVIVAALALVSLVAAPLIASSMLLGQHFDQPQRDPLAFGIPADQVQRITLTTEDGLKLAAWRVFADADGDSPRGTVVILSGIQQPSVTAFFGYADLFAQAGWDSLLIEMRARSLSEGTTIGLGYSEVLDIKAGVDLLNNDPMSRASDRPIVALGTSMGGSTVLMAAASDTRIDAVIAVSAFSTFADAYVDNAANMGMPRFLGNASKPVMNFLIERRFGAEATAVKPICAIAQLGDRPVLLMQSTEDREVPASHFKRLKDAAQAAGVSVQTFLREGNHHFVIYSNLLSTPAADPEFSEALLAFVEKVAS